MGDKRFTIKDLTGEEIQTVHKLYDQGSFVHQWDVDSLDKAYVYHCFTVGDLPSNGTRAQFVIQVIGMKETGRIVGFLTKDYRYPMSGTFNINYLYIDKKYHKQGLGQEVVTELLSVLKRIKNSEVRANDEIKIG
ncbi:GNAT family N-acetyltransferase [Bacillus sp. 2205SS5-2]|uniref:GNAT family N-acetyltransferase n=1 Tax=Bacillus sp. 2205SS5-2 TaxID=3109031 RepID=UPI00300544BF